MEHQVSTGALLREVARLHIQLQRSCVAYCCDTTVTQCTVLTELGHSAPVTLAELSRHIGFDKSWTSRAVENLVQEGLVEKIPSQTDRRTIQLSLSASGEVRLRELNQALNGLADQAMERIPDSEHANVYRALEWLQKALLELTEDKQLPPALAALGGTSCAFD
jgi:DNA-binding MarR family transcriptional regulator